MLRKKFIRSGFSSWRVYPAAPAQTAAYLSYDHGSCRSADHSDDRTNLKLTFAQISCETLHSCDSHTVVTWLNQPESFNYEVLTLVQEHRINNDNNNADNNYNNHHIFH